MEGRPTKYIHLIRAMRPGDIIYLTATDPRFDRQILGSCHRDGIKISTRNLVAVECDRVTAYHLVRIERLKDNAIITEPDMDFPNEVAS